jgi:hypothetical protein
MRDGLNTHGVGFCLKPGLRSEPDVCGLNLKFNILYISDK